jgi:hypothetical protein
MSCPLHGLEGCPDALQCARLYGEGAMAEITLHPVDFEGFKKFMEALLLAESGVLLDEDEQ